MNGYYYSEQITIPSMLLHARNFVIGHWRISVVFDGGHRYGHIAGDPRILEWRWQQWRRRRRVVSLITGSNETAAIIGAVLSKRSVRAVGKRAMPLELIRFLVNNHSGVFVGFRVRFLAIWWCYITGMCNR